MTQPALIESLRRQADSDAAAVWAGAHADAERHRDKCAAALVQERGRLEAELEVELQRCESDAALEAQRRARELRAAAAIEVADRLLVLARAELPRLRQAEPDRLFDALAQELPPLPWQRVRVNPDDVALARRCCPAAEVTGDPGISGGMELECEDGRLRVSNTLETRLATAWPDLLPGLVAALARDRHGHGPAA